MYKMVVRFKSGREFHFKCEEYNIHTFNHDGSLCNFSYKGGVGECPVYFQISDIEVIAIIREEEATHEKSPSE